MAVEVHFKAEGSPKTSKQHLEGGGVTVSDGHLFVTPANSRRPVAVYAPGAWKSAVVSGAAED